MFCLSSVVLNPLGTFGFLTRATFPFANISVTWNFSEGKGHAWLIFFSSSQAHHLLFQNYIV